MGVASKVEVWSAGPALGGALGHNAPDITQGQFSGNCCLRVLAGGDGSRSYMYGRPLRSPCCQNVRGQDSSFWPTSLNGWVIFALFPLQPSRLSATGVQAMLAV